MNYPSLLYINDPVNPATDYTVFEDVKLTNLLGTDVIDAIKFPLGEENILARQEFFKELEDSKFRSALSDVYDKILEFNFSNRTLKYLYGRGRDIFETIQNIPMQLEEATKQWIQSVVVEEDVEMVEGFFRNLMIEGKWCGMLFYQMSFNKRQRDSIIRRLR